tara:strand:+ start:622 stop:828 length:207 start_codon:yes stop_codon:yes gene_type:complete
MTKTITIKNALVQTRNHKEITFQVLEERPFTHNGNQRVHYTLRKLNGRVNFVAVKYEDGEFGMIRRNG